DPGGYRKHGEVWVEGEHLCDAFVRRGGQATQAVITEAAWEQPSLRALAESAAAVAGGPAPLMQGLSTLESPPPLGFVLPWPGAGVLRAGEPSVVLDRLQDAG